MTLTEISYYSRRAAPFVIIAVLIVFIFYYAFKILFLYVDFSKPSIIDTNTIFGAIKPPKVSQEATPSGKLNYTLDTIEGNPITATQSAQVFFLPKSTTKFGFREKINLMATQFGIDPDVTRASIVGQQAKFADEVNSLSIDIATFNFTYVYNLSSDAVIFENVNMPIASEVEEQARDFLTKLDRYPEELAKGKVNLIYLKFDPVTTELKVVEDANQANIVEADFFRPDIVSGGLNITTVSPKFPNSQNYVAMVFHDQEYKVIKAQMQFFDTSKEQIGVYPLIPGIGAYQKLQAGNALFVSVPNSKNIRIKKMFLGYMDPDIYQEYLQPVYVFLGVDNFVAYVPAVADEYLAK